MLRTYAIGPISVLYGASRFQLDHLQSILNAAARIILRIPKLSPHLGQHSGTSFIGSQFASGPSSRSACSFGTALSALPRLTSRNSASPFPPAPAVGAFDQQVEGTLLSLEWIQLDSGGAASLCLGRPSGIPYRRRFDKP